MYATYGAAMDHAQVLEAGVKHALLIARTAEGKFRTSCEPVVVCWFDTREDSQWRTAEPATERTPAAAGIPSTTTTEPRTHAARRRAANRARSLSSMNHSMWTVDGAGVVCRGAHVRAWRAA